MTNDMTVGNPRSLILRFAIPLIIGNIFQQFYNVVDSIVVGRFIGVNALAAVGATGSLVFLIMGVVMGMTSGFSVLIAQSFGAKDEKRIRHFVIMSGYLCVIITIILTLFTLLTVDKILIIMHTPDTIFKDSSSYLKIIYAGIGITMLYNMLSAILRALGDSKSPLYFLIVSSILNVVLDLLFVVVYKMGVPGVGYATVIAQGVSAVLCLIYMIKKYPLLKFTKDDMGFSPSSAGNLMKIGIPMSLQFSITALGTMVVQSSLNTLGAVYIAAYTASIKAQQIFTQPFASLGATMATYVGQNTGAGEIERIKRGVKDSIIITLIYSVAAALVLVIFGGVIVKMFVSGGELAVIDAAKQYFNIVVVFFPFLGLIFIYRNTLQGLGDGLFPMLGGVFELVARGIIVMILTAPLGYVGICLADPCAWAAALIPLVPVYYIRMKKLVK